MWGFMQRDRKNVVSWSQSELLTRKAHAFVEALMRYQKHTLPDATRGRGALDGDSDVIINAIYLQEALLKIIEASGVANARS